MQCRIEYRLLTRHAPRSIMNLVGAVSGGESSLIWKRPTSTSGGPILAVSIIRLMDCALDAAVEVPRGPSFLLGDVVPRADSPGPMKLGPEDLLACSEECNPQVTGGPHGPGVALRRISPQSTPWQGFLVRIRSPCPSCRILSRGSSSPHPRGVTGFDLEEDLSPNRCLALCLWQSASLQEGVRRRAGAFLRAPRESVDDLPMAIIIH